MLDLTFSAIRVIKAIALPNGRLVLDNAEYQAHLLRQLYQLANLVIFAKEKSYTKVVLHHSTNGVTEAKKLVAVVIDRSHGRAREK